MKKVLFSLVLSLLCSVGFAQLQVKPEWNKVLSDSPGTFKTQLISSSENSVKVNIQVPGFYSTTVKTPNGEAYVITVPKSVSTAKAGEPDMPMTGIPVMIGDKAQMNVRVLDAQYMDFEGIEVAPSKGDFPRSIDPATVPYTYGECYSQDAFFPTKNFGLYEPYIIRDFRGQNMVVYPFAYNPVSKTLRVYYDMTVEMYKVNDKGSNIIESRRSNEVKLAPDFKNMYQRHFINFEEGLAKYTPLDEEGDLLIICYDNFISYMTDFVNWKKTRGINTTIVGTSTAGSTYSAIQTYIKNQYNANNNLSHVLLVGDVAQIPGYSYSGGGSSYSGLGDNAYGQVAGSDIYNDVIIGRFSASTAARVTTQCNRAIAYERDLTTSDTWLNKAEGISRKEGGSGHNSEDDYQHMDNIRTDLLNFGYSTVYQRYANLTGYDGSTSTISSDINSGVGIINYANHGQETAWGANSSGYIYYANSHVNALTNDNKLPFIFSVACLVGKYDHSSDCFAEAWMNATNGSNPTGAIGTLMSYISQPWIPPMWAQDECIDILLENGDGTATNTHTYGGVCVNGMFGIFDHYSTSETSAAGTYQAWIVYGDPTLVVRTKTPQAMTVTHDGNISIGSTSYNVTVNNGNGASATITNANHDILGTATVSGTTATINISGTLTAGEELTLCVFGYNKVTYLGTINVVGGTQYTVAATASPTAGGTITGTGSYYANTSCTLTATANSGYEFTNWKNGSTVLSSNPSYTFTVTDDVNYTATFTKLTAHSITCATVNNGTVYSNKTSAYKGETVTLSYSPASGYFFSSWNVKDASNNTITVTDNQFTMPDSNVTVSATFVVGYNVTLANAMNGTISASADGGIAGTAITLTATPASGYVFDSWLVYKTDDVNTTVTVTNNQFTLPAYDVTVVGIFAASASEDVTVGGTAVNTTGWALPTHVYYNYCLTQQIYTPTEIGSAGTITAISFYYLGSSTSGTASSSGSRSLNIYMSNTNTSSLSSNWINESTSHLVYSGTKTFNAVGWYTFTLDTPFEYDGTSNLLLTVDDNTGSYSVSARCYFRTYSTGEARARYIDGDNSDFDPTAATSLTTDNGAYNTTCTDNNIIKLTVESAATSEYLTVSPASLIDFTYAEGQGPSAAQSINVIGAHLVSNLSVAAPADYEVCLTANGTFASTLSIAPSNGTVTTTIYVRLKEGLAQNTYNNETLTLTSGSASQTVALNGEVTQGDGTYYAITATAYPTEGGTVTGGNTYKEGATATLTATANAGYSFVNWTKDGSVVSTSSTYSFTVNEAGNYVANFNRNSYTVTATANPTAGGTVTGAGSYYENDECTLTATANSGYAFTNWTSGNTTVSTQPTYTFKVTGNATFRANFEQLTAYTVTLAAVENGTISADQTTVYNGTTVTLTATPDAGYYFGGWTVKDANNNTIAVTDNQFVMPASNVTVSATFVQGYVITLADVTNGTISASTTTALPGETITLTATPDTDHFLSTWLVFQTGDVKNTLTVSNNQFTMPAFDVTVFAMFKINETEEVTVGSGTSTNNYLPTYAYYNYSLTQQIYTAEEIGGAGSITAIAFKVSNSKSTTRTLDVYLKATTATEFTSTTGWTACATSDKVFSGSVTFSASDWTTITLDTPFEYDGTSNLIVCVDDNTGSYVSSSSNSPKFYVYSTNANRALRYYNDSSNPNPASPSSVSGSYVTSNNQITFTKSIAGSGAYLTVSPNTQSGFTYVEGQGPSEVRSLAVIGVDLTDDVTITAPANFEIADAINGSFGNTLTLTAESKGNRDALTWGFEGSFEDWTTIDADGDGYNWDLASVLMANYNHAGHTGDDMMSSESYHKDTVNGSTVLTPDNWLVSPQVTLGGTFTMYACAQDASYAAEHFGVFVSTSSNTNTSTFVKVNEWTLSAKGGTNKGGITRNGTRDSGAWYEFSVDLSAYDGQTGYIAVRHFDCTDMFYLNVDDFTLDIEATPVTPTPAVVELMTANVYVRLKADLPEGTYANEILTAETGELSLNVILNGEVLAGEVNYYTINATADPENAGTIDGTGRYQEGAGVILTAHPAEGYYLVNWTENGEVVCVNNPCVSTATADRTLVAHFALNTYEVTATANPTEGGTITGTGTFGHGNTATLTATAAVGYTFSNWTNNGTVVSNDASYSFTVTETTNLTANFTLNSYAVSATADPTVGGSILGTGNYSHGSTATLTASPANGYYFINWTLNGEEVSTNETLTLTVTEPLNVVAHFGTSASQTISLNNAYNWFSTYIYLEGSEGLATLETALGDNSTQIKSMTQSVLYDEGAWLGTLTDYDITKMYQICNTTAADITLTGSIVNPTEHPITIESGWNWIGFPVSQAMDLNEALANLNSTEEDVIKSRSGFSSYINGYGWWGTLNTLNPGEGYKYNSLSSTKTNFTYPGNSRLETRANITTEGNHWMPDNAFANTINIMATIPANSVVNASENVEIGAFVNGECRGSAKLMYVEPLDQYIAFLTVYGDEDETVNFNVYNEGNQYNADEQVVFVNDAVIGKVSDPFVLHISGNNSLSLYPNPVSKGERVTVELNGQVDLNGATIQVYNALGSLIRTESFTQSSKTIEALLNSGIYTIKVTDAQGNAYVGKVVVR